MRLVPSGEHDTFTAPHQIRASAVPMFPTPMIAVVTALSIRLRFARRSRQRSLLE